jgi:hypothetical protein
VSSPPVVGCGPHVAVGCIDYGAGKSGWLVYVKSSLSGDENDYIRDYARRFPRFPHETTGDQFFSEEQFEVYRALGFHAMYGFLEREKARVAVSAQTLKDEKSLAATVVEADDPRLEPIMALLGV